LAGLYLVLREYPRQCLRCSVSVELCWTIFLPWGEDEIPTGKEITVKIRSDGRKSCALAAALSSCAFAVLVLAAPHAALEIKWLHLSSRNGNLPNPGGSNEQTGLLVANLDKGTATGFVISYRVKGPALVWFRRVGNGWSRYVIEPNFLTVEAGGAAYDIDGDGDLDIVFGGDYQSNELWWWENPYPNFDPNIP